jgi:hypothetical protein
MYMCIHTHVYILPINCVHMTDLHIRTNQPGIASPGDETGRIQAVRVRRSTDAPRQESSKSISVTPPETDGQTVGGRDASNIPLTEMFAKKAGEWVCDTCMVTNKAASKKVRHVCVYVYVNMCVCILVCV